jgi:hypothetical protein
MSFKRILWASLLLLAVVAFPVTSSTLTPSQVLRADGGGPIPPPPPIPWAVTTPV